MVGRESRVAGTTSRLTRRDDVSFAKASAPRGELRVRRWPDPAAAGLRGDQGIFKQKGAKRGRSYTAKVFALFASFCAISWRRGSWLWFGPIVPRVDAGVVSPAIDANPVCAVNAPWLFQDRTKRERTAQL